MFRSSVVDEGGDNHGGDAEQDVDKGRVIQSTRVLAGARRWGNIG